MIAVLQRVTDEHCGNGEQSEQLKGVHALSLGFSEEFSQEATLAYCGREPRDMVCPASKQLDRPQGNVRITALANKTMTSTNGRNCDAQSIDVWLFSERTRLDELEIGPER